MKYAVEVVEVRATPLAAAAANVRLSDFTPQVRRLFDEVYSFLEGHPSVKQVGHNVIIYDGRLADGCRVEMGVQVDAAFEPAGEVLSTTTPAGRVARTLHVGPYAGLPQAHEAVIAWCKERNLTLVGRSWEVYGDWHDDPASLRTEVMHLLA